VDDPSQWERVLTLDAEKLWLVHGWLKRKLLVHAREQARHLFSQHARDASQLVGTGVLLDPRHSPSASPRRFATYSGPT